MIDLLGRYRKRLCRLQWKDALGMGQVHGRQSLAGHDKLTWVGTPSAWQKFVVVLKGNRKRGATNVFSSFGGKRNPQGTCEKKHKIDLSTTPGMTTSDPDGELLTRTSESFENILCRSSPAPRAAPSA